MSLRLSVVSLGQQQNRNRTENHLLDLSLEYIPDTSGPLPTRALQKHKTNNITPSWLPWAPVLCNSNKIYQIKQNLPNYGSYERPIHSWEHFSCLWVLSLMSWHPLRINNLQISVKVTFNYILSSESWSSLQKKLERERKTAMFECVFFLKVLCATAIVDWRKLFKTVSVSFTRY